MTTTRRTVRDAEFPPNNDSPDDHSQRLLNVDVLKRTCLHGGPVTVATVRFPPPESSAAGENDERRRNRDDDDVRDDERRNHHRDLLESRGRVVFARGPWIESRPLFVLGGGLPIIVDDGPATAAEEEAGGRGLAGGAAEGRTLPPYDERCYKILAYGDAGVVGGSTIECISGMIFPSSAPSLSYLKSSPSSSSPTSSPDGTETFVPPSRMRRSGASSASSSISVVAFGGRRMSFLSGGGLWDRRRSADENDRGSRGGVADDFRSISIRRRTRSHRGVATCPYLEVSDWIHDIRMLDIDPHRSSTCQVEDDATCEKTAISQRTASAFLMAVAMASNNCEIWAFRSTLTEGGRGTTLCPTRLQCVACDVRCMTYSLSLYGWDDCVKFDVDECATCDGAYSESNGSAGIPALLAASGTVFGDIVVWGVVDDQGKSQRAANEHLTSIVQRWLSDAFTERNDGIPQNKATRIRVCPLQCLKGHLGSVFKVKFSECGNFIASTSDDRTVRLWMLTPMNHQSTDAFGNGETYQRPGQRSATEIIALDSSHFMYTLAWTGWGHTARVWDVSFASHQIDTLLPVLVSAGEDGTARVWSPLSSTKEIAHPLRGHRCESIWTVDVCEGIVVTGGNDGCVKLFGLESRVRSEEEFVRSFFVPRDPLPTRPIIADKVVIDSEPILPETDESVDRANANSRKKKKKKVKQYENGQAICGMAFYSKGGNVPNDLLVATRAGGLFSLDLASDAWCDHSSWSEHVMSSFEDESSIDIDPSTGSCVEAHPSGKCAVVGTTEGWLVISPLCGSTSSAVQTLPSNHSNTNIAFHAPSYRPVQSVTFTDESSLLVFYARGVVIWFEFDQSPTPLHVMILGTTGIPLSFANNCSEMYIGDSRGNIAYFALNETCPTDMDTHAVVYEREPDYLLTKVHGREHVTGLAITSAGVVISVGNDGCMHQCKRDANGEMQKLISIPVPNVTGLRHIWIQADPTGIERVILGGFYGNDFVMLDSTNGYYELLRIATGGRQRRQDLFFNCNRNTGNLLCSNVFGLAILTGQKDGINSIDIHCSQLLRNSLANTHVCGQARDAIYSIGPSTHGETINDACWVEDDSGNLYLLTGSNDCSVTLSKIKENTLDSTVELPPHESCVRGVCSSGRLLVTCGGKLSMEFYILGTSVTSSSNGGGQLPCFVSLLCSYRTLGKATIDHRMNTVRATSLFPLEKQCHLVLAGDSDGNLHLCVISERVVARRTIIGTKLQGNGRPVLCLALLRCNPRKILAFVGTTGGEISVWVLPGIILSDGDGTHDFDGMIPNAPLHSFKAHQTGVNSMSVADVNSDMTTDTFNVIITSVGDDQALSTCMLEFTNTVKIEGDLEVSAEIVLITKCASASALKGVKFVSDSDFHCIYTIHSAEITTWHLFINHHELVVNYISSSPLGTEGSCIDSICQKRDGSVHEIIAVGGEGLAVLSLNVNILRAARKLHDANYLLITAGAGFSADSGLQTYECAPTEYSAMCNPSKLMQSSYDFQRFWLKFTRAYSETDPHFGYELLDQWCSGGRLRHLNRSSNDVDSLASPWWVYTSNVDGHFRRFKSFANTLCEIHGSALLFRCAGGIGYANGEPRLGKEWHRWNKKILSTDSCKQTTVEMSQNKLRSIANSDEIFLCCHCGRPMRPNVLMFHDTDENVLNTIDIQRERYQTWESLVEDYIAVNDQKLVILEMGCGMNVPAVREESVDVLLDCAKKVKSNGHRNEGSVCLIRINPKDSEADIDGNSVKSISIASTAAVALQEIDAWIKVFARCYT